MSTKVDFGTERVKLYSILQNFNQYSSGHTETDNNWTIAFNCWQRTINLTSDLLIYYQERWASYVSIPVKYIVNQTGD